MCANTARSVTQVTYLTRKHTSPHFPESPGFVNIINFTEATVIQDDMSGENWVTTPRLVPRNDGERHSRGIYFADFLTFQP